ncbi:MAG: hypothetical protein R3F20_01930 [Planctomycetota bacterium]
MRTRDLHAVHEVLEGLLHAERRQVIAHRDALPQLPETGVLDLLLQLGLPEQEDLDELLGLGLEVRDQPDLLHRREGQVLRLVDDEDDVAVLGELLDEELVDRVEDRDPVSLLDVEPELAGDGVEELDPGQTGVRHQRGDGALGLEVAQERAAERRLAGPDLSRDHREPLAGLHGVEELGEGLVVALAREEEARVRRVVEGRPVEAEIRFVHRRHLPR